jgi:hypothetical protein
MREAIPPIRLHRALTDNFALTLSRIFGGKVTMVQAFIRVLRFLLICVIPPMIHTYSLIYRLHYTPKLSQLTAFLNKQQSFLFKILRFLRNNHKDFDIQRHEYLKINVQCKMQTETLVERQAQELHKSLYTKCRKCTSCGS